MKCHKNGQENGKRHSPLKHMLMMVLCCGAPILIVAILPFINIGGGFKGVIAGIAPFICPLMMMLMIPMMFKGMKKDGACCGKKEEVKEQINTIQ